MSSVALRMLPPAGLLGRLKRAGTEAGSLGTTTGFRVARTLNP